MVANAIDIEQGDNSLVDDVDELRNSSFRRISYLLHQHNVVATHNLQEKHSVTIQLALPS